MNTFHLCPDLSDEVRLIILFLLPSLVLNRKYAKIHSPIAGEGLIIITVLVELRRKFVNSTASVFFSIISLITFLD